MNEYDFIIDGMIWSFSRLNSFDDGCLYGWKKIYIDCAPRQGGAFGEYGSWIHSILQGYFNGEYTEWDLPQVYQDGYKEHVTHTFPKNAYVDLDEKYYQQGLDYLTNFSFDREKYEILGVEKEVRFEIAGQPFVGYIDLLLRDKTNGNIVIVDHKSSSFGYTKQGVSKKDQKHFKEFQRQLYLYCIPIIKEYGKVDTLEWNMFRDGRFITIPFNKDDFDETMQWANDVVQRIKNNTNYLPKFDYYYCANLCDVRTECPYRRLGMIYQGIYAKCYSEKSQYYPECGGIGITMCDEWKNDMNAFFTWAFDSGYSEDMILKRYDETADFDFFNCYWDEKDMSDEYVPE